MSQFSLLPLASVSLEPGNFISWLIVGGLAGWITGRLMGGGFGFFGDIILGLVGALLGGFLASLVLDQSLGFWGTLVVSVLGSVIIVAILRMFGGSSTTRA